MFGLGNFCLFGGLRDVRDVRDVRVVPGWASHTFLTQITKWMSFFLLLFYFCFFFKYSNIVFILIIEYFTTQYICITLLMNYVLSMTIWLPMNCLFTANKVNERKGRQHLRDELDDVLGEVSVQQHVVSTPARLSGDQCNRS